MHLALIYCLMGADMRLSMPLSPFRPGVDSCTEIWQKILLIGRYAYLHHRRGTKYEIVSWCCFHNYRSIKLQIRAKLFSFFLVLVLFLAWFGLRLHIIKSKAKMMSQGERMPGNTLIKHYSFISEKKLFSSVLRNHRNNPNMMPLLKKW